MIYAVTGLEAGKLAINLIFIDKEISKNQNTKQ